MSAENSARSVRQADGLDPVRALQRVLYRSAKQDRTRRFHALYDKLARSDVMWRAWVDVATNKGAPGVDGVSIESVADGGVESVRAFLDELAAAAPGRDVPAPAVAAGAHTQAGQTGPVPAARHTNGPGIKPGRSSPAHFRTRSLLLTRSTLCRASAWQSSSKSTGRAPSGCWFAKEARPGV